MDLRFGRRKAGSSRHRAGPAEARALLSRQGGGEGNAAIGATAGERGIAQADVADPDRRTLLCRQAARKSSTP